jgi:predicted TIM-barrel fold metal-dependent hydrolase
MKTLKFFLTVSIVCNVILFLYTSSSFRIYVRFMIYQYFGFSVPDRIPKFAKDITITEFFPKPILNTEDIRLNKLPPYPIIESHGHLGKHFKTSPKVVFETMDRLNVKYMINLSFTTGESYLKLKAEYNDPRIIHFTTFHWKHLQDKKTNWADLMLSDLQKDIQNGTRGIKLWKNFGLDIKKPDGTRLTIDDPILDPLFKECEKAGLVISIHTVDPKSFFEPIDQFNERYEELLRRPEWAFDSEKYPDRKVVLQERNRLFQKHSRLTFVALHVAESAESLDDVALLLDQNPNVYIDIAARIDELGRQPYKARKFLTRYQDRILFGTDGPPEQGKYEVYSRFLETTDEYFDYHPSNKPRKGFWKIYGVFLDTVALEKIYYRNAEKVFRLKTVIQ